MVLRNYQVSVWKNIWGRVDELQSQLESISVWVV